MKCWTAQNSYQQCVKPKSDQGNTLLISDPLQCNGSTFSVSPTCGWTPGPERKGKLCRSIPPDVQQGWNGAFRLFFGKKNRSWWQCSQKWPLFVTPDIRQYSFIRITVSPLITYLMKFKRLNAGTEKLWAERVDSFLAVLGTIVLYGNIKEWEKRMSKKQKANSRVCHL